MRVLMAGISGRVVSRLAECILADHPSVEVHGLIRWRSRLDHPQQTLNWPIHKQDEPQFKQHYCKA